MFFLEGVSFKKKYQRIYINTRYNKLSKLVVTTQSVEYIVRDNNIEKIISVFVIINNFIYFFVSNFNCLNSFFKLIRIIEINIINNDSVK